MDESSKGDPSPYFGEVVRNITATVRGTMQEFTRHAKEMKAPHQHRPELRGSGVPRKRGKGRA